MAENTPFQLNGYSYADCKATLNGVELPGITSFDFSKVKNKFNNYGMGANPTSRSRGANEYEGSLEMDYDTQQIASTLSPTNLLVDVPASIFVLSLEKADGGKEVITLGFFEFMGDAIAGSTGDENLVGSVDVIFGSYTKTTY